MLYRKIETLLEEYLKSDSKKTLLVDGARQVGKTFIIRHVGQKLFENFNLPVFVGEVIFIDFNQLPLNAGNFGRVFIIHPRRNTLRHTSDDEIIVVCLQQTLK